MGEKERTVLLVEDDPVVARMYARKLKAEGYEVISVSDGQEGLNILGTEAKPDLILLDLIMPKVDGFRFLEIIKENPEFKDIPVILLSNVPKEPTYLEWVTSLGADDFIVKSELTPKEVVERVDSLLEWSKIKP